MAGLYIHIPFCKQACTYCNFHFSTSLKFKSEMLDAIQAELVVRSEALIDQTVESVYFGGGTPSLLTQQELHQLWSSITRVYNIAPEAEVTLEANPDDLSREYLEMLQASPVNRLSIGVQSFAQSDLVFMHRAHTVEQAHAVLSDLLDLEWKNTTIDLIYGTPDLSNEQWQINLEQVAKYHIPHLSAYQLTVEPRTALGYQVKQEKVKMPTDEQVIEQFRMLTNWSVANGFNHYEISNLARPGHEARHNGNYWNRTDYLGFGPAAHSLIGNQRSWNVANNMKYIKSIQAGSPMTEVENLSATDIYNELVMTGLRKLKQGLRIDDIQRLGEHYVEHLLRSISPFVHDGMVKREDDCLVLTNEGQYLADHIASSCFQV